MIKFDLSTPRASRILWISAIVVGIVIVAILASTLTSFFKTRSYEKREAERVIEREALTAEKQALVVERDKWKTAATEAQAMADAMQVVAESKRSDRVTTTNELAKIEADYERRKKELETTGSVLSDTALRDELCRRLRARGYECAD